MFNPNSWIGVTVNCYADIERAQVPMDGSPMLFMLTTEPVFYIVSMQNGRKTISGYSFTALQAVESPTAPLQGDVGMNTLVERVNALESVLEEIRGMLSQKEGKSNESCGKNAPKGK